MTQSSNALNATKKLIQRKVFEREYCHKISALIGLKSAYFHASNSGTQATISLKSIKSYYYQPWELNGRANYICDALSLIRMHIPTVKHLERFRKMWVGNGEHSEQE